MRSIRGLYVIRSGCAPAAIRADSDDVDETEPQDTEADATTPDDGRLATLEVDFSRFDTWYEIDSIFEGRFLERVRRGAFRKTFAERGSQVKVLFNHGMDMYVDSKALGVVEELAEHETAPHLEAGLLDTSYNRDLLPALRAGAYGSSFMFEVLGEEWDHEPKPSRHNPDGLPERSITEVRLYEAGPVTWPANPEATAGVRASGTDWYVDALRQRNLDNSDALAATLGEFRAAHGLRTPVSGAARASDAPDLQQVETPDLPGRQSVGISPQARQRRLALLTTTRKG